MNRVPKGVATGGQFATTSRIEPGGVTLEKIGHRSIQSEWGFPDDHPHAGVIAQYEGLRAAAASIADAHPQAEFLDMRLEAGRWHPEKVTGSDGRLLATGDEVMGLPASGQGITGMGQAFDALDPGAPRLAALCSVPSAPGTLRIRVAEAARPVLDDYIVDGITETPSADSASPYADSHTLRDTRKAYVQGLADAAREGRPSDSAKELRGGYRRRLHELLRQGITR